MKTGNRAEKRIILRYVLLTVPAVLLFWLIWHFQIRTVVVRNETTLDAGTDRTFIAEDNVIDGIGLSYDAVNREVYGEYDTYTFSGFIRLLEDENAGSSVIWEGRTGKINLPVLTASPEELPLQSPVSLETGKQYRLELLDESGRSADELSVTLYGSERNFAALYWPVSISVLILMTMLYFSYYGKTGIVLSSKKIPFGLVWVVGLLVVSLLESVVMTPPCVPDGEMHFYSSYAVSNQIMQAIPFLRGKAAEVPLGVLRLKSFGEPQYIWHFWNDWTSGNVLVPRADSFFLIGMMPHYSYVIPAIGLTIARIINAPWQMYLILGQTMNVLLYAVITLLAIRVKPEWKRAITAITLLPSTLWILNSFSYDVWNLAFLILAVAYCAKLSGQKKVSVPELLLAVLLMVAFIPIKFIYFNFALCLFLIRPSQWRVRNRKLFMLVVIAMIAAEIAIVFAARGQEIITFLGAGGFDLRSDNTLDSTYTLGWVVQHPLRTVLIYLKTLYESAAVLFINLFLGDNYQGYIPGIISTAMIGCFFIAMDGSAEEKTGRRSRIFSWVILITGILIVMTSFLFVYSTKPAGGVGTIAGMQGRYFSPYLICLPVILKQHKWARAHARQAEYLLAALTLFSLFTRFTGIVLG